MWSVSCYGGVGRVGLSTYYYCPRDFDGCRPGGPNAVSDSLGACRQENVECLIFARNEDIQVPDEIID
jgi:hypothetical protein